METTLSLLRDPGVTHVAVATDSVIESFRNDLFPGYKTSAGVDPALLAQFPLAERAFRSLGLVVWGMVEFEADDAIATAAARLAPAVEQVVIATPDKDLAQCVIGSRVVTWNRRTDEILDEDGVRAKYGVSPGSIPDYLALVGDTADGVPGLPGWGAKSTAAVLSEYHYLDDIPDDPESWTVKVRGASRLAEVLRRRRGDALAYRELTTLRTDVPLDEDLADLEWKGVRWEDFEDLCDELGFEGVRERVPRRR